MRVPGPRVLPEIKVNQANQWDLVCYGVKLKETVCTKPDCVLYSAAGSTLQHLRHWWFSSTKNFKYVALHGTWFSSGGGGRERNISRLYKSLANWVGVISIHFVHWFQIPWCGDEGGINSPVWCSQKPRFQKSRSTLHPLTVPAAAAGLFLSLPSPFYRCVQLGSSL